MGKIFDFFSGTNNKSGKGVTKKQVEFDKKLGFAFFFKLLKMRLGKFSATNLIFALCNIFFFIAIFGLTGTFDDYTTTAADPLYALMSPIAKNDNSPAIASLFSVYCGSMWHPVVSTVSRVLQYSSVLLIFTFGLSTIGMVYNIRNICTGEYIDTWRDFFYAIKRNFKQGIVIGVLDSVVIFLLAYDLVIYGSSSGNSFFHLVLFYAAIFISIIYYIMRFYIYLQLVTCEMKIFKMIKNAFFLTALGFKRNFVGLIGAAIFALAFVIMYIFLPQAAIIFFCMFVFSFLTYIGVYCGYPVVKKYVIDPYYEDHPDERPEDPWSSEEQVFIDRG